MVDAVLGKDEHSGRDDPRSARRLFARTHSDSHTSVLMKTHSSKVG